MDKKGLPVFHIAVCDDDKKIHQIVEELLNAYAGKRQQQFRFFHAYSAEELLEADDFFFLLFLDIEMPGMDGIEAKNILEGKKTEANIIFMTSHEERVMEAFGKNVVGFLKKPVEKEQLLEAFDRVFHSYADQTIEVEKDGKLCYLSVSDIHYIVGQDKYTEVFTQKDSYLVRKSLAEWEQELPDAEFCRVNRSYIIHFDLFDGRKNEITLDSGEVIKLSRQNKQKITEKYRQFLRSKMERLG